MKSKITGILALLFVAALIFSTSAIAKDGNSGDDEDGDDSGLGINAEIRVGSGDDDSSAEIENETEIETENSGSDDESETEIENETEIESETEVEGGGLTVRTTIKEKIRERIEDEREKYENKRERYLEVRQNYVEVREKARASIDNYLEIRQRWADANASGKSHIRTELNIKAKVALQHQVEALLKYLESGKERGAVDANRVDVLIQEWTAVQLRLEDENVSGTELLEISRDIRQAWLTHRSLLKVRIGAYINDKINDLAEKANNFSTRTKSIVAGLKAEGKDTSLLERGIAKLDADLNLFAAAHARIEAAFGQADTSEEFNAVLEKANRLLKAMNEQLKKDFRLMKALFKATRELNASVEISADTISEITASSMGDDGLAEALSEFEAEVEGGAAS